MRVPECKTGKRNCFTHTFTRKTGFAPFLSQATQVNYLNDLCRRYGGGMESIMRIGHGYDAHRFGGDRPFVIGGVRIPHDKLLDAHSDGDTLAHAVIDALFGAAGLRDIGAQYPDSDKALEGADSIALLADAVSRIVALGFSIEYLDCTIVAQAPKMARHIAEMRKNLADACRVDVLRVNVKATTEEHMGFTGDGTGIAAHAVCLLRE